MRDQPDGGAIFAMAVFGTILVMSAFIIYIYFVAPDPGPHTPWLEIEARH